MICRVPCLPQQNQKFLALNGVLTTAAGVSVVVNFGRLRSTSTGRLHRMHITSDSEHPGERVRAPADADFSCRHTEATPENAAPRFADELEQRQRADCGTSPAGFVRSRRGPVEVGQPSWCLSAARRPLPGTIPPAHHQRRCRQVPAAGSTSRGAPEAVNILRPRRSRRTACHSRAARYWARRAGFIESCSPFTVAGRAEFLKHPHRRFCTVKVRQRPRDAVQA